MPLDCTRCWHPSTAHVLMPQVYTRAPDSDRRRAPPCGHRLGWADVADHVTRMPFRTTRVAGQGRHLLIAEVRLTAAVLDVDHLRPALQRHHVLPSGHHRHMIEQWLARSWGEREDVALQAGGEALEDRQHVIAINSGVRLQSDQPSPHPTPFPCPGCSNPVSVTPATAAPSVGLNVRVLLVVWMTGGAVRLGRVSGRECVTPSEVLAPRHWF